jgi:C-5 cytosine-specific DNA methylase
MKPRLLDLFSGIGGISLGLERAGFHTMGFCEPDKYASGVLRKWWPDTPNETRGIIALNALLKRARTSSGRVFRVRTYPLLAKAPDLPEVVRDSCGLCFEPFAWFDQEARCWRTWQRCLVEGWEIFSGTWPRSGMTRNGIAFRRQPLVRPTFGTGSGSLLPTPEASNTKAVALRSAGRSPRNFLMPIPTPTAMDARGARNKTSGRSNPNSKHHDGTTLNDYVRMWPTPCARDHFPAHKPEYIAAKKAQGHGMSNLNDAVGGALNPTWVEWLMGFPLGWTVSDASATASSRKSSKRSAAQS